MKKISIKSKALIINKIKSKFKGQIQNFYIGELKLNEILVKLNYSSINYKDILVCNGLFWGCRNYPLVPGIDGSGIVIKSKSKKFKKGDSVAIIASDAGSKIPGCFSNYIKIKDIWVNKLTDKLSRKNAMIFGTAGFTAMSIVNQIQKTKRKKSILITGASGGVGLFSTFILSKLGHNVTAVTRKDKNYLLKNGAQKVILLKDLKDNTNLPLQKTLYDICVDNIGGNTLDYILKRITNNGTVYSVGFTNNNSNSSINLMPFILRRTKLIGVHTESLKITERMEIWKSIQAFIKKFGINKNLYKKIKLTKLPYYIKNFDNLKKRGRFLIIIDK